MQTKFGPSGNSADFYASGNVKTIQAAKWLAGFGLSAYEYSFGRGINLSDETAKQIGEEFSKYNVDLSVHAPYYINFANEDAQMIEKSIDYVIRSARKCQQAGGKRIVFHSASVGKATREKAVDITYQNLLKLTERIYAENLESMLFCPETMGKYNQIGTVEEIAKFCSIDKIYVPTIDFGHLYARSLGEIQGESKYREIVSYLLAELGDKARQMHVHFSKIEFSKGGEVRHLTYESQEYGPNFAPLAVIIKHLQLCPTVICESAGTQTQDSITMMQILNNIK